MRTARVFSIALLVGAVTIQPVAAQSTLASRSMAGVGADDVVRPGDQIRLRFWREPEYSGAYDVGPDGQVVLPFIGRQDVGYRSTAVVKADLERQFQGHLLNQDVQVVFLKRIRVLGAVNRPGVFQVDASMTLSDVVALAGGARVDGKLEGAELLRGSGTVQNLSPQPVPLGASLRSGDEIFVPQQSWFSRHSTVLVGTGASVLAALLYRGVIR